MIKAKEICQQLGLKPTKSKGQNFLVNEKILENIIMAADLKMNDTVLEIGPGLGILTETLASKVKKVMAVELDKRLASFLKQKFAQQKNIKIVEADILKLKPETFSAHDGFASGGNLKSGKYKLVANLPYNITGAVLRKFLAEQPKPNLMVLMLQKEVVERILEKNDKRSIISLIVFFYCQPEIIRFISKNNFWPKPKVDSAILKTRLFKKNRFGFNKKEECDLLKVIKTGFASPRKQIINNLTKIWLREKVILALNQAQIDFKTRAEDINLKQWVAIYRYLYAN